ncbi:MAG: DUF4198 domain-containing protein [Vicinamibacterales bacterium]
MMTSNTRTLSRLTSATLVALSLIAAAGQSLSAHDMWIEPGKFLPEAGEIIALRLRVGQGLLGDPLPRDSRLVREFIVEDSEGRKPVVGRDGSDPAGFIRVAVPGLLVVGYHSTPSVVDLTPELFNQYVREEGLDAVAALRATHHTSDSGGRDSFIRCAKSLLLNGAPSDAQRDRALGMPLELVAEKNPYMLKAGQQLPVRLTYEQRPLAGALVVAINKRHPDDKVSARTDSNGRVQLPIATDGTWLIKAVHMIPAKPGTGSDWSSYWASLTFGYAR